jgi:arsenate reductase (glutaredoxin)
MMREMNSHAPHSKIPSEVSIFGIPNCATVKNARTWLAEHDQPYLFHDFKKMGISADKLAQWMQDLGWETLINRKGTTWRKLDETDRAAVVDATSASTLMMLHTSLIKRPVVEWSDGRVTVGFTAELFAAHCPKI